ncbi:F-box/kelch-repeat protein At5g26960 [Malania oleifera]|uniref:F-box/kelch-repeat protein At5g26960 n=1 Tax=Malania oleifera TaxID=397392 RepID=UPI0025ADB0B2|nr:F-box/kelch-repeat protein At5g26960 [Malania oleifera]
MSDSCNSRHFSWLVKSCFPTNQQHDPHQPQPLPHHSTATATADRHRRSTPISSLPDDILLECLSRVPPSSLPSVSLVCRRWSRLLHSPSFTLLRRRLGLLRLTLFAVAVSDYGLLTASHCFEDESWQLTFFPTPDEAVLTHARAVAIGRRIYILGRNVMIRYDAWTGTMSEKSPTVFPRKKFAAAVIAGKIYVAGGAARTAAVEEYDPDTDEWRVVADAPRRRYGCIGAAVDGVFYVIGGLKIGASGNEPPRAAGVEAHVYASSMDLYDVEAGGWLRSRAVPGGGCVVAACAAGGHIFVLASHAVELSFWRFDGRRKGGGSGGGGGFGEWCRIRSPPLPAQVRVDGSVRFGCVGVGEKVVLVQVTGSIDDLLRRSGRSVRGMKGGLVLVYDCIAGEWSRGADLPEVLRRAACVCVEC